jgi:hypothetical protein
MDTQEATPQPANDDLLEFDLQIAEVPVKLNGKDGKTTIYVLRELTGEQRDKYLNGTLARAKTDAEGKVAGVRDLTGYQAALLCLAMRRVEGGEVVDGKLVKGTVLETEFPDPGMVQSWPSRVQGKLFKRAQKMSGINEEEKPAAKN